MDIKAIIDAINILELKIEHIVGYLFLAHIGKTGISAVLPFWKRFNSNSSRELMVNIIKVILEFMTKDQDAKNKTPPA